MPRGGASTGADDLEWTARLLRREPGMLVPASVVVRDPACARRSRSPARALLASRLRLLGGDALQPRERPWFAFRLAEQGLGELRERASGLR
jgi:hypothetical protein